MTAAPIESICDGQTVPSMSVIREYIERHAPGVGDNLHKMLSDALRTECERRVESRSVASSESNAPPMSHVRRMVRQSQPDLHGRKLKMAVEFAHAVHRECSLGLASNPFSDSLNPMSDLLALEWFGKRLIHKEVAEILNGPIVFIGNGPYEQEELERYLMSQGVEGGSITPREDEDASCSVTTACYSPIFIIGQTGWSERSLRVLLGIDDIQCPLGPNWPSRMTDKEWVGFMAEGRLGRPEVHEQRPAERRARFLEMTRTHPFRVDTVVGGDGVCMVSVSDSCRPIRIYSQELLIAWLLAGENPLSEPSLMLKVHAERHPALKYILSLGGFQWPSTDAGEASGETDIHDILEDLPQLGLLKYMGYSVGMNGEPTQRRHDVLEKVFLSRSLPRVTCEGYMQQWGEPKSAQRVRKMANSIATFCRNAKHKSGADMGDAIAEWEDDLDWMKQRFYDGHLSLQFKWPTTDRE
jgi:hypothetical protein